ncbi:hypothetical protein [Amycolatopsis sp. H20-H5]|uniref:hypothetical protein n=1 Tax=Amycolatopsis sp. H20-H5 TaxID=3046309 RepID=UPI002DBE8523|nr:hypothetical protein [Amycolatopsis sp. H20-H5]MEC3976221.1 hypothetical protein [Amycolatopsis sp. H20-H5]
MKRQTIELVNALQAVNKHVGAVANALLTGTLPIAKQHEFAGLLTELGDLLHQHAEDDDSAGGEGTSDDEHTA